MNKLLENIARHEPGLTTMKSTLQQAAFNEGVVYGKWQLATKLLSEKPRSDELVFPDVDQLGLF